MVKEKVFWLDFARALACVSVIAVHVPPSSTSGSYIDFCVYLFGRIGVPFFIMISGGLNLIYNGDSKSYFKKRFPRILMPFFFWSIVYIAASLFTSFNLSVLGYKLLAFPFIAIQHHLWFIFLILGLYLVNPIISPWIQKSSNKEICFYLILWILISGLNYLSIIYPSIKVQKNNILYSLQYFSGFIGYYVLGYFIVHRLQKAIVWYRSVGVLLLVLSGIVFYLSSALFNVNHFVLSDFLSISTILLSCAVFFIIKSIHISNTRFQFIVYEIAEKSFGIYLAHLLIIDYFVFPLQPTLNVYLSQSMIMPFNVLVTFLSSYILIKFISYFPKKQYFIG